MNLSLQQKAKEKKISEVEELVALISENKVVTIAKLYKVRAMQLQELRKKLGNEVFLKVSKNNLMIRALKKSSMEKLSEYVSGPSIFLLTNINPFKLAMLLEKTKISMAAKYGDIASSDIKVSPGNTGLPPGHVISEMREVGIKSRIETGSVWITQEAVVVKNGEKVSEKAAGILSKLGLKPIEVYLTLSAVFDSGLILEGSKLKLNLEEIKQQFETAFIKAYDVSMIIVFPTQENITTLIKKADRLSKNFAVKISYPASSEIMNLILKKANINAIRLLSETQKK